MKTISWRFWATVTTALIVLLFTRRYTLALTVGSVEVVLKLVLYFVHERAWSRVKYGKREVPAFVLWFTGLPASGKTTAAATVCSELAKRGLKVEHLDSHDVRALFPETGFTREEVDGHVKRVGHLASMLEKQGVIVVASFVSPYRESRAFARELCSNFVEVYLDSTPEASAQRDTKGMYTRARAGEIEHFPGVNGPYEEPVDPEIRVAVDGLSPEEVVDSVLRQLDMTRRKSAPKRERRLAGLRRRQGEA
ncbi:MAG: adenylyl-sulfate kinase [Thermoleophilia bacterium]|nr:adenylyl-sulfate kinase [Thermoleophilia bacterium]